MWRWIGPIPSTSIPRYIERNSSVGHRDMHNNIHWSTVVIERKKETGYISINRRMNKTIYNGILYSDSNE